MSKQEITNQENSLNKVSKSNYMELLTSLDKIIFNLTEENIETSIQQTMKLFDLTFPYSFNTVICNLVFSSFCSQKSLFDKYLNYLLQLQKREEEIDKNIKIIDIFVKCIIKNKTQESYYLIEKMIEQNLIDASITKNIKSKYFAHYKTEKENKTYPLGSAEKNFINDYEKLSANDWELHKQSINEGVNPNEIMKIIRNDDIEKLQEISSQNDFDFNQTIAPSIYERCDFINKENVTLIDYAAFFGSVKCFKYLLMNNAKLDNTGKYAVAGGNEEIIHLCEQNHSSFEGAYETAIEFHKNDVFKYIYDNKLEKLDETNQQNSAPKIGYQNLRTFGTSISFGNQPFNLTRGGTPTTNINDLRYFCVDSSNFEILSYLEEKEVKINDSIINESAKNGNLYLVKHFLINNQIPKNILEFAIGYGNVELIIYLLEQEGIDINATDV